MLHENLKNLRKNKGFTQDELASRLNVVRQTISKWEKGYSVPDAEMLQRIAEVFDTDVSHLLGNPIEQNTNVDLIAEQLARINEQLVIKNKRSRKIWKVIGIVVLVVVIFQFLLVALGAIAFDSYKVTTDTYTETIEDIEDKPSVTGVVEEVHENYIIMYSETAEGYPYGSRWSVSLDVENQDSDTDLAVGDEIIMYYDGMAMETDPLQVNTVYAITLKTPAAR